MSDLLFLDVETLDLWEAPGTVWEVAFKVGHGSVVEFQTEHDPHLLAPEAAAVNHYHERVAAESDRWAWEPAIDWIEGVMKGAVIVGSNPDFDMRHLAAQGVRRVGHHKPIDVTVYAMGAMGAKRNPGLVKVLDFLTDRGHDVTLPDHTATNDVLATYDAFYALRGIYENRDW